MFDIGWSELVVIGVVALIAIGPKELPGVLRSVGFWMGKVRRMAAEFQGQFQEAMREAEMADLKKHADDLNNAARQITSGFENYEPLKDSGTSKPVDIPPASVPAPHEAALNAEPATESAPAADAAENVADDASAAAMPETSPQATTEPGTEPTPEPLRREA